MASQKKTTQTTFRLATVFTLLSVIMGSMVCATESGLACPTWPGCYPGQPFPSFSLPPWIEFTHRMISAGCLILLAMSGVSVWRSHRDRPLVRWLPWVAFAGAVAAAVFGMSIIFWGLPAPLAAFDLLTALAALFAITLATVALGRDGSRWTWTGTSTAGSVLVGGTAVLHMSGILVAGVESYTRCLGWPLLSLLGYDGHASGQVVRWVLAAAIFVGLTWMAVTRRGLWALALGLLVVEVALGFVLLTSGISPVLATLYSLLATGILFAMMLATARAAILPVEAPTSRNDPIPAGSRASS
ncbi:MAG TPA: hypothetical protein PKE40_04060 [Arachnia sp.]|nr:hypothetical protein [Arachnia sp.]HMT85506.1 hypothetical protein [Arachnia sp.]